MNKPNKTLTILFSFIPGAGHMYMGLMAQGVQIMIVFFSMIALLGWLQLGFLAFIPPIIWFYSVFDAYHRYHDTLLESLFDFNLFEWLRSYPRWVGWTLIIIGALILSERLLYPLIDYNLRYYLKTGLVAIILIAGGVKLLMGTPEIEKHPGPQSAPLPNKTACEQGNIANEEVDSCANGE